jgi:hypothetical protein
MMKDVIEITSVCVGFSAAMPVHPMKDMSREVEAA